MNKPPTGLKPREIFLEERISDVKQAIQGYFESNQEVPSCWIEEYNVICAELNNKQDVIKQELYIGGELVDEIVTSLRKTEHIRSRY